MPELESTIGYNFINPKLLETALTHSSYANEHDGEGIESNERFEFLGDAVTGLEVAHLIFSKGPHLSEGQMTQMRATLVRSDGLAGIARQIGLGRHLRLGVGADKTDVRENTTVLEDAFEALVAAVFLDGGTEAARCLIHRFFAEEIDDRIWGLSGGKDIIDYKSRLQEALQRDGAVDIKYTLLEESGPDHSKWFRVSVASDGVTLGTGEGKTKKIAEKMAARMAFEKKNRERSKVRVKVRVKGRDNVFKKD